MRKQLGIRVEEQDIEFLKALAEKEQKTVTELIDTHIQTLKQSNPELVINK